MPTIRSLCMGLLAVVMMIMALLAGTGTGRAAVSMPAFSLPDVVSGKTVSSEEFKGKGLLVVFFATWCPPCRQEIPTLIKLQNDYRNKGFSVIGLSVDEGGPKIVAQLVKKTKINYPVLMADRSTAGNFGGITGVPTAFLVNRKGHVVKKYPGAVPHAILERDIKEVLR